MNAETDCDLKLSGIARFSSRHFALRLHNTSKKVGSAPPICNQCIEAGSTLSEPIIKSRNGTTTGPVLHN